MRRLGGIELPGVGASEGLEVLDDFQGPIRLFCLAAEVAKFDPALEAAASPEMVGVAPPDVRTPVTAPLQWKYYPGGGSDGLVSILCHVS